MEKNTDTHTNDEAAMKQVQTAPQDADVEGNTANGEDNTSNNEESTSDDEDDTSNAPDLSTLPQGLGLYSSSQSFSDLVAALNTYGHSSIMVGPEARMQNICILMTM